MSLPRRTVLASASTFFVGHLGELLDVAAVQPRRAAAADVGRERALDAVALVDLHEVLADRRLLVLDEAGREHRHAALRA